MFLNLEKIGLTSAPILSKVLKKVFASGSSIEVLVLNQISCLTDQVIMDFIAGLPEKDVTSNCLPSLKELHLASTKVTDKSVQCLFHVVCYRSKIETLNLENNPGIGF